MIFNKMHNLLAATLVVFGSLFLFSCNDEPTPVGYSLVNDTLSFHNLSSAEDGLIVSFESKFEAAFRRNTKAFFVGKAEGIRAVSMLRFDKNLPDSLLSFISPEDIQSVKLKLTPARYVLGDSSNTLQGFKIYQMNKWYELGLRYDSIFVGSQPIDYVDPEPIVTAEIDIPLQDSMPTFSIDLTSDKFKQQYITWLEENERDTTTSLTNWGLLIAPLEESTHINSFKTQVTNKDADESDFPSLELIYNHKDGRLDTIVTPATMDGYLTDLDNKDEGKLSLIHNAEIVSILTLDVSKIPHRAAIHKSYLEFKFDRENSILGNMPVDSILAVSFEMNGSPTEPKPMLIDTNGVVRLEYLQQAIEYFKADGGKGELKFVILGSGNASTKLDRLRFYGMDAEDPTMRPKLNIVYSMIIDKTGK